MRKSLLTIDMVKQKLNELRGSPVSMQVCRGRKQIKQYKGIVEKTFPFGFVVRLTEPVTGGNVTSLSYSYNDVVCGEVVIFECSHMPDKSVIDAV